jgi:hypothetical protein
MQDVTDSDMASACRMREVVDRHDVPNALKSTHLRL